MKKNTENQSIAAAVLRCSVGNAKAASTASAGRASINARSDPPIARLASSAGSAQPSGTEMWRCNRWRRQRHSVHSASGQAGHSEPQPLARQTQRAQAPRPSTRQRQARRSVAQAAARPTRPPTGERRAPGNRRSASKRPAPPQRQHHRHGWRAAGGQHGQGGSTAARERPCGRALRPARRGTAPSRASWTSSGVVSWPSCSRPERGHQRQHGAVGDGAGVVDGLGLAAEGKGHRLRRVGARQVVGGVPGQHQDQHQQQREGNARRHRGVEPGVEKRDEGGTQPVRHQRGVSGRPASAGDSQGARPSAMAGHVAESSDVGVLPGVPAEHARQHVGGAEQQQRQPRQPLGGAWVTRAGVGLSTAAMRPQ